MGRIFSECWSIYARQMFNHLTKAHLARCAPAQILNTNYNPNSSAKINTNGTPTLTQQDICACRAKCAFMKSFFHTLDNAAQYLTYCHESKSSAGFFGLFDL